MLRLETQIDTDYLSEISGGDPEFEQELVATFLDSAPALIAQFHEALDKDDARGAIHAAHTLKGSSRSIGGNAFALTCEAAEKYAREGDLVACRSLAEKVEEAFDELRWACETFVAKAA